MLRILTILILVSRAFPVFAQQAYHPGYLITNSGDTLRGYLNYSTARWGKSPLRFREDPEGPEELYTPDDLSGYGFPGDMTFGSGTLPDRGDEKFFYLQLIEGPVRLLYLHKDPLNKEWYLLSEEKGSFNLSEGQVGDTRTVDDIRKNQQFRGYIRAVVGSCADTWPLIEKASLSAEDLVGIMQVYYDCTGETYTNLYVSKSTFSYQLSVHGGVSYNQLSFATNPRADALVQPDYLPDLAFDSDWQPTIGAEIEFYRVQSVRWWTVVLGAYYHRTQFDGASLIVFRNNRYRYEFQSTFSTLHIPAGIRVYKKLGDRTFFAEAGPYVQWFLAHDVQIGHERIQSNEVFVFENFPDAEERTGFGFWLSVGTRGTLFDDKTFSAKIRATYQPDYVARHFIYNDSRQFSLWATLGWAF